MPQQTTPPAHDDHAIRPVTALPERPALAADVRLLGPMQGMGFQQTQWLIARGGRFLQVTELLYRVAEQIDGERALDEIAAGVTANTEWLVTAEQVRQLIQAKLAPLGLIASTAQAPASLGPQPAAPERTVALVRSPLRLNMRTRLLGPRLINPLTRVLQFLYWPALLVPLLGLAVFAQWWLFARHGFVAAVQEAVYTPGLLLVVLLIALAASVFHEFGHASALRYGGGQVRGMGAGLYFIYPAFYTDVTDSYRLGRLARVRTDLGGIYFHLLFALGTIGLYQLTHAEYLLAIVLLIDIDIITQFIPFARLDGYWALTDLAGVPDFFSQAGPFLARVLRLPDAAGSKLPPLKRWSAGIFLLYLAVTVPVLALLTYFVVSGAPSFALSTKDAVLRQNGQFLNGASTGNVAVMVLAVMQMVLIGLGFIGLALVLYGLGKPVALGLWRFGRPTWPRRAASALAAVGLVALLASLWIPQIPAQAAPPPGVQSFAVASRLHVTGHVTYAQTPPVGGNHSPVWQNCGFYAAPIENEHAVHSMEHGAVWITYRPDLPADQVDRLRQLAHREQYVIVSPYPGLPAPVVASAWARQLRLASASDPRLAQFVRAFALGDQAPERGGPCTGGTGSPQ
jgi:putative peptide zinc metalloprotease protein